MKQPLDRLIDRHRMNIQGVIHIGTTTGEEYLMYRECGINPIIWFEPGDAAEKIPGGLVMPFALGDKPYRLEAIEPMSFAWKIRRKEYLWESFPDPKHSSFLQPYLHLAYYPDNGFRASKQSTTIFALDEFIDKSLPPANFLVIDTNGYDLEVLKGGSKYLPKVDYIYTEVYKEELYKDVPMIEQIDEFLTALHFTREETWWYEHGWGDALYIRK